VTQVVPIADAMRGGLSAAPLRNRKLSLKRYFFFDFFCLHFWLEDAVSC
jgi:hypothetical protein